MPRITSRSLFTVPAPMPYATPSATPNKKMMATMPLRNGECSTLPSCGSRRKPSAGSRPHSSRPAISANSDAAKRRPRFSAGVSGFTRSSDGESSGEAV